MTQCNHVWRDTPRPTPKQTANELYASVVKAGNNGWWLKGIEYDLCTQLIAEGKVKLCEGCDHKVIYVG